jgi:hypothetical protein
MRKILLFFGLVSVLALGLVASKSYASETMGSSGLNNLVGAAVEDSCGKVVGIVNEVIFDSGGHAFAIVNHGDYDLYGEMGANTPVPLEELQISQTEGGQEVAFLKTDMEHLVLAPYLNPMEKESLQDEANIYEYYGIQPSFTRNDEFRYYEDWDEGRIVAE